MDSRKEVKQNKHIRTSYSLLTGEEKKIYWESFKMMAKGITIDEEKPPKNDHG